MNRLTQVIASGDLEAAKEIITKTHFKVILDYLESHINHDIPEETLNCLLTHLPHWEDASLHLHDSIVVLNTTSSLIWKASPNNLKVMLQHPTFAPSSTLGEYVTETSLETFKVLMTSSKIHDTSDTLETLLEHNDVAKMQAYLEIGLLEKNLPSADKVTQLIKKYKTTSACLAPLFADHRIDIRKVDLSYPFLDQCFDQNIQEALTQRVQECIALRANRKSRHMTMLTGKEEVGIMLEVIPNVYSFLKQDGSVETLVAPVIQDRIM